MEEEKMLVRLLGDASGYQKTLKDSVSDTKTALDEITGVGSRLEGVTAAFRDASTVANKAISEIGSAEWLKSLGNDADIATKKLHALNNEQFDFIKKASLYIAALVGMASAFSILNRAVTALGVTTYAEAFSKAWTAASVAVVAALGLVKAAVISTSATIAASPLISVVAIAAAVVAIHTLVSAISGYNESRKKLNEELKKSNELHAKERNKFAEETQDLLDATDRIYGGKERQKFIETEVAKIEDPDTGEGPLEEKRNQLEELKKRQKELSTFRLTGRWTDYFGLSSDSKRVANEIQEVTKDIETMNSRVESLTNKLALPKELVNGAKQLRYDLQESIATMGKTGRDLQIFKLENKINDSEAYIQSLEDLGDFESAEKLSRDLKNVKQDLTAIRELSQQEKQQGITRGIEEQTQALERQIRVLREGEEAVKKWEMEWELGKAGFSPEEIEKATSKIEKLNQTIGIEKRFKEMKDEGEKLSASLVTPLEKFKDSKNRIEELYTFGAIDDTTYDRAMKKIKKEFDEAENSADKAASKVEKFDAALLGSAESGSRVQNYLAQLGDRQRGNPSSSTVSNPEKETPVILKDILAVLIETKDAKAENTVQTVDLESA